MFAQYLGNKTKDARGVDQFNAPDKLLMGQGQNLTLKPQSIFPSGRAQHADRLASEMPHGYSHQRK